MARLVFYFKTNGETTATAWHSIAYIEQWFSEIQPSPAYECSIEYKDETR